MKRYKHNLSHYHLTTFDLGEIIPIANIEVNPGDSVKMSTSALIRMTPLLKPVMHPVQIRIHNFFVPYRILWTGWEDFITGESATAPPQQTGATPVEGKLHDYLGVPDDPSNDFNLLHTRAYNKIVGEYYYDNDLDTAPADRDWETKIIV